MPSRTRSRCQTGPVYQSQRGSIYYEVDGKRKYCTPCNPNGREVIEGRRGGAYYVSESGRKVYCPGIKKPVPGTPNAARKSKSRTPKTQNKYIARLGREEKEFLRDVYKGRAESRGVAPYVKVPKKSRKKPEPGTPNAARKSKSRTPKSRKPKQGKTENKYIARLGREEKEFLRDVYKDRAESRGVAPYVKVPKKTRKKAKSGKSQAVAIKLEL